MTVSHSFFELRRRRWSASTASIVLSLFVLAGACSSGEELDGPPEEPGDPTGGSGGVSTSGGGGAAGEGSIEGSGGTGRPILDGPRPPNSALGFYDIDENAEPRAIRNDLSGELGAMVQFAQSHTVDPAGNTARNHPTLVAERAALVLITPREEDSERLELEWSVAGEPRGKRLLSHPNDIPRADSVNGDGRPDVVYSKRAWWLILPWDDVVPGLELVVRDEQGREGKLEADAIEFASPAELVLKIMRLGMLVEPPVSDDHWMVIDPVRSASDYFETQPIAQLVLGSYEPVQLERVMVRSGVIYTSSSSTSGGVYDGDMRQDCAKSSYSGGVNNADQGIVSSAMSEESNPRTTAQVVIHHAQGRYTNGVQSHGLSGGAGIGTLWSSEGNELTHELGHNWTLGHYPGQDGDDYYWAAHHHESGWGFVHRRQRMRANLHWTADGAQTVTNGVASNVTWNNGTYSFNNDPMSGADVSSSLSRVTHHTGYTARISQEFFDRGIVSVSSPTGYMKWNAASRKLEPHTPPTGVKKPTSIGVPIYTFWGGYDPNPSEPRGVLYPALRGNYGHVFDLTPPAASGDACWVEVTLPGGAKREIALAASRHSASSVNKLHFNLPQSARPQSARLLCRFGGSTTQLDSIEIAAPTQDQPPAVHVGKAAGFRAYQELELSELGAVLEELGEGEIPEFDADQWELFDRLYERFDEVFSPRAHAHASRLLALLDAVRELDSWMTEYADELDAGEPAVVGQLERRIRELGLAHAAQELLPPGQSVSTGGGCLTADVGERRVRVSACDESPEQRFVMDARGAIHPRGHLELCFAAGQANSAIGLGDCDWYKSRQSWELRDDQTIRLAQSPGQGLDNGGGSVLLYGIHGGTNQRWSGLSRSGSLLLATLSAYNLPRLHLLSE